MEKKWKIKDLYYHYVPNSFLHFAGLRNNTGCVAVTMDSFHYLSKVHRRQIFFLKEIKLVRGLNEKSNIILTR